MQQSLYNRGRIENKFLSFYINDELYGIPIGQIHEIIAMMKVTPVPRTPAYVKGVINLRGTIIPLIDIRIKFEMGTVPETMYTAIIVCRVHGVNIGFIVDRVEDVLLIGDEHLAETPRFDTSIDTSYIRSVAEYGESVMIILDLEKMFDRGEFETLHSLNPIQHTEGTVP